MATGAVVAGRGTFEPAGGWGGDHHDGVPICILSQGDPDAEALQWPLVTYVDDVTTAMSEAKRAAGEKNVLVHGAGVARLALAAGVLDEIQIHLIPVLLGQGRHLFEGLPAEQIELERIRTIEGEGGVTHCVTASSAETRSRQGAGFVGNRARHRHPIPVETAFRGGRWPICDHIRRFSAIDIEIALRTRTNSLTSQTKCHLVLSGVTKWHLAPRSRLEASESVGYVT